MSRYTPRKEIVTSVNRSTLYYWQNTLSLYMVYDIVMPLDDEQITNRFNEVRRKSVFSIARRRVRGGRANKFDGVFRGCRSSAEEESARRFLQVCRSRTRCVDSYTHGGELRAQPRRKNNASTEERCYILKIATYNWETFM